MSKETLILTGFMGMGKSTVGRIAASFAKVGFFDTDTWMAQQGIDVPALVISNPERFRRVEAESLAEIAKKDRCIIATGGGIVSTEIGRNALLDSDVPIVWLRASFELAALRVKADSSVIRPLFSDEESARRLHDERLEHYSDTAKYVVDAARKPDLVAADIASILAINSEGVLR